MTSMTEAEQVEGVQTASTYLEWVSIMTSRFFPSNGPRKPSVPRVWSAVVRTAFPGTQDSDGRTSLCPNGCQATTHTYIREIAFV